MMPRSPKPEKLPVTVFLSREDYDRLAAICKERGQSRADYLRSAIKVPDAIPVLQTRPLTGACLDKHLARVAREKRGRKSSKRKG